MKKKLEIKDKGLKEIQSLNNELKIVRSLSKRWAQDISWAYKQGQQDFANNLRSLINKNKMKGSFTIRIRKVFKLIKQLKEEAKE